MKAHAEQLSNLQGAALAAEFGALSAALRVHSTKDARLDRRPWISGERETAAMRRMYHMRSELMPYIYSSVWQTHSTMVSLNRKVREILDR